MKKLTEIEVAVIQSFLKYLAETQNEKWLGPEDWPWFPGLPEYSIFLTFFKNGARMIGLSFAGNGIMLPNGKRGELLFFSSSKQAIEVETSQTFHN